MRYIAGILATFAAVIGLYFVLGHFERGIRDFDIKPENHLKKTIPSEIGEMISKDLPLGSTEEIISRSEKLLSVTEWLNREYILPDGKKFVLYMSYWSPNKLDVRFASLHTPDRCWVENGWKNDASKKLHDYNFEIGDKKLIPAYYREYTYESNGFSTRRYVWFWFIVDGNRYEYGEDALVSNPISYLKNAFTDALMGSPEQYFVRIDSETPLSEIVSETEVKNLLGILGKLILYPKTKETK